VGLRLLLRAENGTPILVAGRAHTLTLELTVPQTPPTIVPGGPVREDQARTSATPRLYLIFGTLLHAKALEALSVTAPGWEPKYFGDPTPSWTLTPRAGLTLTAGQTIAVTIANVVCRDAQDGQLIVDYYNFGVPDGSIGLPLAVRRSTARELRLDARLVDPSAVVFISEEGGEPIQNRVSIIIANPSPTDSLAPRGTTPPQPPTFRITCSCGDAPGYGAVTTPQKAADIRLDEATYKEEYASLWKIGYNPQAIPPYVTLTAEPSNAEVLGAGGSGTVQLTLTNIVTELAPGVAQIYVEWRDIPGWRDGSTAVPIRKVSRTKIAAFAADRTIVDFGRGPVPIAFTCDARNACIVKLNGRTIGSVDTPHTLNLSARIAIGEPTSFSLTAAGPGPDNEALSDPLRVISTQQYLTGRTFGNAGHLDLELNRFGKELLRGELTEQVAFTGDRATYSFGFDGMYFFQISPVLGPHMERANVSQTFTGPWRVSGDRVFVAAQGQELQFQFDESLRVGTVQLVTPDIVRWMRGESVFAFQPRVLAPRALSE
jgi:hypothetical protein